MSDIIRLLPDAVANQIAAGEVIQRPSSVIKELVENAIDAGATQVNVLVTDAGKTSIQVIDDGKGMSETDARLAFERHATSKIRKASDLFALQTMGFRGEALASIAAVAQVELKTRMESEELGTLLTIAGSKVESQEAVACSNGSSFSVKNLFYNVPARRKFLKSNQTELSNIIAEFERIALVNPDVSFTLHHNDTELFHLPSCQIRQRIMGIFGKKINQDLLSVEVNTTMIRISGFVGHPDSARKKGARQFFFVNGRYMRHPYFHKAVMEAYEKLIPIGEQVPYFLYFEVDPANIDVNIHPTKTEIKFENEQAIWQIIAAAVKETLGRFNAVPSIDFDTEGKPEIPAFDSEPFENMDMPQTTFNPNYNPFDFSSEDEPKQTGTYSSSASSTMNGYSAGASFGSKVNSDWEKLYDGLASGQTSASTSGFPEGQDYGDVIPSSVTPSLYENQEEHAGGAETKSQHYQFKGRYILTSVKSGLMVIDQQRAHIRILYERFLSQIEKQHGVPQGVLFPEIVQFSLSEVPILQEIMPDLSSLGFELTDLGGGSYSINGVPGGIEGLNPVELVQNMVQNTIEKGNKVKEEVQSMMALTLAKASAIVPGQVLSNEEMNEIVDGLLTLDTPNYTPDGKTVLSVINDTDIEKMFK